MGRENHMSSSKNVVVRQAEKGSLQIKGHIKLCLQALFFFLFSFSCSCLFCFSSLLLPLPASFVPLHFPSSSCLSQVPITKELKTEWISLRTISMVQKWKWTALCGPQAILGPTTHRSNRIPLFQPGVIWSQAWFSSPNLTPFFPNPRTDSVPKSGFCLSPCSLVLTDYLLPVPKNWSPWGLNEVPWHEVAVVRVYRINFVSNIPM